jgi:4-hydroxybenzoate polyprenyltransferase
VSDVLSLLRPSQWIKNAFVLAPLVFSRRFFHPNDLASGTLAFACFCVVSSATYVFNDVIDRERDRSHPLKRARPVASGRVPVATAVGLGCSLTLAGLVASWPLGTAFLSVVIVFLLLQLGYSFVFKNVAVLDALAIAFGFVLRAVGGVIAVDAAMSPWLLGCTFVLATFLALAKRRQEMSMLKADAGNHRAVLERYTLGFLDRLIVGVSVITVALYAAYSVSPSVETKLGTERLYLTVPFVVFGVFRYLFLVYRRNAGGNPTDVLLRDPPLQVGIVLWIASVFFLLY